MTERLVPPSWCMPTALIAATLLIALVSMLDHSNEIDNQAWRQLYRRHRDDLRSAAEHRHAGTLVIVTIGNSLIREAVLAGPALQTAAAKAGLPPIHLVRLVGPGAPVILDQDLLKAVAELRPDVLLVQDHALAYQPMNERESGLAAVSLTLRARLRWMVSGLTGVPQRTWIEDWTADRPLFAERKAKDADGAARARFRAHRGAATTDHPRADIVNAIATCRSASAQVAIISIPVESSWSEVYAYSSAVLAQGLKQVERQYGIKLLTCPEHFSPADYIDQAHMSAAGRERFTTWLLCELAARIQR